MPYAVEFDFDAESTAALTALSDQIYAACNGMALHNTAQIPHVSLAVLDEIVPAQLQPLLADFAAQVTAFPLHFAAVGAFPGDQGVVYLAPIVTAHLLALHRDLHEQLTAAGLQSHPYYRPDHWVPHCTVGFNLPVHTIGEAVALCRQGFFGQAVTVSSLRLIEIHRQPNNSGDEGFAPTVVVEPLWHYQFAAIHDYT